MIDISKGKSPDNEIMDDFIVLNQLTFNFLIETYIKYQSPCRNVLQRLFIK